MVRDTYNKIKDGMEIRKSLSDLRQELKAEEEKRALRFFLAGDYSVFENLFLHEDPKVRKNTALVLGMLADEKLLKVLYEAYEREETLFVKSSYLTAIREFDFREYLEPLKERLNALSKMEFTVENKKHGMEEIKALSELVLMMEGSKAHPFTGMNVPSECILLTNRNFIDKTIEQLPVTCEASAFNAGAIIKTDSLSKILEIRTFEEILFVVKGMKTCSMNPEEAAKRLVESDLIGFMEKRHKGSAPFYFRIECKSRMPLDKKSIFTKKMAGEIERLTGRKLINTTSHYEFEIRLIENKSGSFNVLLKLYTLKDNRFSYRKEVIPAAVKPVNAALVCALAADYIREEAKILDPFCGTGTMLIERHKFCKANTMYGIDVYQEAVEKAKINTEEAGQIIHYINRDFFDFKHEYLFDEIITDMPFSTAKKGENEIYSVYRGFFAKAREHLYEDGVILLYSHNRELVKKLAPDSGYQIKEEWEISKKEGSYVYAIQQTGKEN